MLDITMDSANIDSNESKIFKNHLSMEWEVSDARNNPMAELKRLHVKAFLPSFTVNESSYSRTEQMSGKKLIFKKCAPEVTSQVTIVKASGLVDSA